MEVPNYNNIIVILSGVAIILILYRIFILKEDFSQVDICDYNSPDPNEFCKSIQKGCTDLITENKNLNTNIKENCETLPTDTKDMINAAIVCNDTVNKIVMNNYVQSEVCSQIKNFPEELPISVELEDPPVTNKSLDDPSNSVNTKVYDTVKIYDDSNFAAF
jgi:hypothetical protein